MRPGPSNLCGLAAVVVWACASLSSTFALAVAPGEGGAPAAARTADDAATTFDCPEDGGPPPQGPIKALPRGGVGARGVGLLLSGENGGEVEGALIWTSSGREGGSEEVAIQFMVEVDGRSLLAASPHSRVPIEVYGYLVDETGTVVRHLAEGILLEDCRRAQMIDNTGLKFVGTFSAEPGLYSLRILVHNGLTRRFFLVHREIDVRIDDPSGVFVLPPLVAEPPDSWVMAGEHDLELNAVRAGISGLRSWPSAMPAWRAGEVREMVLGCAELGEGRRLSAQLSDRLGNPVLDPEVEVGQLISAADGLAFYRASVAAPAVASGEYRLAVVVTDPDSGRTASQSLPVLIHDRDATFVWTDPAAPRIAKPIPPTPPTDPPAPDDVLSDEGSPSASKTPDADTVVFDCPDDGEPSPTGPIQVIPLAGVGTRGAALLMSGQSGGEVEGAVIWTSGGRTSDAEQASIQFMVEIDGRSLLAASPHPRVPIEVFGYLVNDTGAVVGHLSDGVLLENCGRARLIHDSGLKYVGELSAPPGLYSFRILVRNRLTRRFFLARRDLDVRVVDPLEVFLLPPLVAEAQDSWVMAGKHGLELDTVRDEIPGIRSWPSAMPVWRADEPLQLVLGCSGLGEGRQVAARLYDRFANSALDPVAEVGQPIPTTDGLTYHHVSIAAPDVPAGEYRLAVVLTDTNSGTTVSQSLQVIIHDLDSTFVWTDPDAPRIAPSPPSSLRAERPAPPELEAEAVRSAYMEALRLWSTGEAVSARRTLAELEQPLESSPSTASWRLLFTGESQAAMTLANSQPASLMAVALLHRDMYSWYLARREPQLASHSWQMAAMMARAVTTLDGWTPPDGFSEFLLLDLAARLSRSGQWRVTRQLLDTAIDIAPDSAPVRLGLGALYERTGFPREAVDELKTLVKKHPDNLEGRLRLAVNHARIGDDKQAEELLRGLLAPSSPLWIRTLAHQELGRLLIAMGRVEEAVAQLREGIERIPDNQRLHILLAHALDEARRSNEAESVIDRLNTHGSRQSTSPRYRYSVWPDLDSDRALSTLADAQAVGLGALREALQ